MIKYYFLLFCFPLILKSIKNNCEYFFDGNNCFHCNSFFFNNSIFDYPLKYFKRCSPKLGNFKKLDYFLHNSVNNLNCSRNCPSNIFSNFPELILNASLILNLYNSSIIQIFLLGDFHSINFSNVIDTRKIFRRMNISILIRPAICNEFPFFNYCFKEHFISLKNNSNMKIFISQKLEIEDIIFLGKDLKNELMTKNIIYNNKNFKIKHSFFNMEPLIDDPNYNYPEISLKNCQFNYFLTGIYPSLIKSFGFGVKIYLIDIKINDCFFPLGLISNTNSNDKIYNFYPLLNFRNALKKASDEIKLEIQFLNFNPLNIKNKNSIGVNILNMNNFYGKILINNSLFYNCSVSNIFYINLIKKKNLDILINSTKFSKIKGIFLFNLIQKEESINLMRFIILNCTFFSLENLSFGFNLMNLYDFQFESSSISNTITKDSFFIIYKSNFTISNSIFENITSLFLKFYLIKYYSYS